MGYQSHCTDVKAKAWREASVRSGSQTRGPDSEWGFFTLTLRPRQEAGRGWGPEPLHIADIFALGQRVKKLR